MASSRTREVGVVFGGHREVTARRPLDPQKRNLLLLNALGGVAVLGSYAWVLSSHPELGDAFWGGVPEWMKPAYTVNMLLAALGYFAFTFFILRQRVPEVRVAGRFDYGIFQWIYATILVPSALWMPLTLAMIETPGTGLWISIRLTLAAVGIGSLVLIASLLRIQPRTPSAAHKLAVAGSLLFALQTAVLDALIWPAFFPA